MVTIAMSKAIAFFFGREIKCLHVVVLKLYLSNALVCQEIWGKELASNHDNVMKFNHWHRLKEPKNGSYHHSYNPIHCQHEFDHDVCHSGSFSGYSSTDIHFLKMLFDHWACNGELFILILKTRYDYNNPVLDLAERYGVRRHCFFNWQK